MPQEMDIAVGFKGCKRGLDRLLEEEEKEEEGENYINDC